MPAYIKSPFKPVPTLLTAGMPVYVWGSFDDKSSPTTGPVINDSANGSSAVVTFQILSGNLPAVGELVTVIGTANGGGNLNVTNATITAVSTPDNGASGVCSVTFASTQNFAQTTDIGYVQIPRQEKGENMVNNTASVPVSVPFAQLMTNQSRTVNATARVINQNPTTTYTVVLQGAIQDIDSEYETLGVISSNQSPGAGPTLEIADSAYRFYRMYTFNFAAGTGGNVPQIIGKITE